MTTICYGSRSLETFAISNILSACWPTALFGAGGHCSAVRVVAGGAHSRKRDFLETFGTVEIIAFDRSNRDTHALTAGWAANRDLSRWHYSILLTLSVRPHILFICS